MDEYKIKFIRFLIKSNCFKIGDFITKSGRQTPYFINTGLFNTGSLISILGGYYADAIIKNNLDFDVLFGPAYKGIPLIVSTSIALNNKYEKNKAFTFNRKEKKGHGEGGNLIGVPLEDKKILILDDVITAGTSIKESLLSFSNFKNVTTIGVLISVDRKEKSSTNSNLSVEEDLGLKIYSIVTIDEIIEFIYQSNIEDKFNLTKEHKFKIDEYRKKYGVK